MGLNSFKELLLKKAEDNASVYLFLNSMNEDLLIDTIIESLEKNENSGTNANAALTKWANDLTNSDVSRVRDAVSHHVSHYKAALKAGNREVADKHLEALIPLMHGIDKAYKHSNGKIKLKYPSMRPWEMNYTRPETRAEAYQSGLTSKPHKKGDADEPKEGTQGLNRRTVNTPRSKNPFAVPDYRYLEMKPHPKTETVKKKKGYHDAKKRDSGYPFEEIQIDNPLNINSGKGFIHIDDDLVSPNKFVSHVVDEHPVIKSDPKTTQANIAGQEDKFSQDMSNWSTHPLHADHKQSIKDAHAKDPIAYASRGSKPSKHFWDDLPLLPQEDHATNVEQPQVSEKKPAIDFSAIPGLAQKEKKPAIDFSAIPGLANLKDKVK
jgi:hypothetical protein